MIEIVDTFNTGKTMNIFECAALKSKMYVQRNTNVVMCQSKLNYEREQLNFFSETHHHEQTLTYILSWPYYRFFLLSYVTFMTQLRRKFNSN